MTDDDAESDLRRQIRAQADADVASFISSLDQDEGSGVPAPPSIKVTETASDPVKLDFIGFGRQASRASQGVGVPPPPAPCPSTLIVTFHDVVFDCACVRWAPSGGSLIATDISGFNDIPVTLSTPYTCFSPPDPDCGVIDDAGTLTYHRQLWLTPADCSGSPDAEADRHIFDLIVQKFGTAWTVIAADNGAVFFYGTTTNILSPISNSTSCNVEIDDTCYGLPLFGAARGGFATITFP